MSKLFAENSKPIVFLSKCVDVIILTVFFVISCLPVFTIGAACTAYYYTFMKAIRKERSYVRKEYVRSFRENFKTATFVWLVMVAVLAILFASIYAALVFLGGMGRAVFIGLYLSVTLIVVAAGVYAFPVLSRFKIGGKELLLKALVMVFLHGRATVKCLLLGGFFSLILVAGWAYWPLLLLLVPEMYLYLLTMVMEPVLLSYIPEEEREEYQGKEETEEKGENEEKEETK